LKQIRKSEKKRNKKYEKGKGPRGTHLAQLQKRPAVHYLALPNRYAGLAPATDSPGPPSSRHQPRARRPGRVRRPCPPSNFAQRPNPNPSPTPAPPYKAPGALSLPLPFSQAETPPGRPDLSLEITFAAGKNLRVPTQSAILASRLPSYPFPYHRRTPLTPRVTFSCRISTNWCTPKLTDVAATPAALPRHLWTRSRWRFTLSSSPRRSGPRHSLAVARSHRSSPEPELEPRLAGNSSPAT
jgi:hypothetical protein